ncbi:MAG: RNA methyltransferase [Bernardetiaceae bacterium]|nr:RNA methyltransferase [Bernardetiaceae bacterium]
MTQQDRKHIRALQQKKYRQSERLFIVEGEKLLLELSKSDFKIEKLYATSDFAQSYASNFDTNIAIVSEKELLRSGTFKTNKAGLAIVRMPLHQKIQQKGYALILDSLRDPGNLGTIIRIADWYAITEIICSEDSVDVFNPKVVAASMGSVFRVPVFYEDITTYLQNYPFPILGTFLDGKSVYDFDFPSEAAILIGSESHGISPIQAGSVHHRLHIPAFGKAESLNAAVATAIICDNWRRSK